MKEPEIYEKLKQLRKERGLTLNTLAEKIGSDYQQISRIERGKSRLTIDVLLKLADALQTPIYDIVEAKNEEKKNSSGKNGSADIPLTHEMLATILERIDHEESEAKIKLRPQTKAALAAQIYTHFLQMPSAARDLNSTQKFIDYSIGIMKTVFSESN